MKMNLQREDNTPIWVGCSFEETLTRLKQGLRARREDWELLDQFLYVVDGSRFLVNRKPLNRIYQEGTEIAYHPHIDIKTKDGFCMPYTPSQEDIFANDWEIMR